MEHDMIMLDKHGDDGRDPDSWTHYRITSVTGLGIPEGQEGSSIQICRLKWPTLEDILPVIDNIGVVGYTSAYQAVNDALSKQWGIDREQSIFIGVRDRYSESEREDLRRKGFTV
jgi:hypothetical protein